MKAQIFITILSIFTILVFNCSSSTEPSDFIEPVMVKIDKDLVTSFGSIFERDLDVQTYTIEQPYEIGKYEITNLEYNEFVKDMGYTNSQYWSDEGWIKRNEGEWLMPLMWIESEIPWEQDFVSNQKDTPVHGISFYEAEAYCNWLSYQTGKNFFLPDRILWIRAAQGPDPGFIYPWGDEWNENNMNYYPSNTPPSLEYSLVPVYSFEQGASIEGCHHMVGNAYELVRSIEEDHTGNESALVCAHNSLILSVHTPKDIINTGANFVKYGDRRAGYGFRICRR
ncbi:formylglycine-generating enzyme family protein [candidate division KSB1 bacterium]